MRAGKGFSRAGFAIALLVLVAGCAGGPGGYEPPEAPAASIYVVTQAWHTGIVMRRADARADLWPEVDDFPNARWLLVDWGDRDYFPAASFSFWYGLKALFWPTASVVRVIGFDAPPPRQFAGTELVRIGLAREGLEALNRYIGAAFERSGAPRARGRCCRARTAPGGSIPAAKPSTSFAPATPGWRRRCAPQACRSARVSCCCPKG